MGWRYNNSCIFLFWISWNKHFKKIGIFIENYGLIPDKGKQEHLADTGIT
jgi:hypothetical protein